MSPVQTRPSSGLASTMRAIEVTVFGGPEVLNIVNIGRPRLKPGEVLVRVAAAGVNYADIGMRRGRPSQVVPYVPGIEASGTVEAIADDVKGVRAGDRVMYAMVPGSYAEFAAVPAARLIPVPDAVDLIEAAALPLQGLTAHFLLNDFIAVGPATTILVHAIAGGVGLLVTQYASHLGAHIIGTTSSEEKATRAKAAGARDVILYTQVNFVDEVSQITGGLGVDLILDSVGKVTFAGDLEAVRPRGHIVLYGYASGAPEAILPSSLMPRAVTISGGNAGAFTATRDELLLRADAIFTGLRAGWLKPTIDRVLPLARAAEAHSALESRKTSGKLLLTP